MVGCEFALGHYPLAEQHARKSLRLRLEQLGLDHVETAESQHNLAVALIFQSRLAEAAPLIESAVQTKTRLLGERDPDTGQSIGVLGILQVQSTKYLEAEKTYRKVLAIGTSSAKKDYEFIATTMNNLGLVLSRQGKYREAEKAYREALDLGEQLHTETSATVIRLANLARVISAQGRLSEAEQLHRLALDRAKRFWSENHPEYSNTLFRLAENLVSQGSFSEAELVIRKALDAQKVTMGESSQVFAVSLNELAIILESTQRYKEAESHYHKAVEITAKLAGENHPFISSYHLNLSRLLINQGRFDEAAPLIAQVIESSTKTSTLNLASGLHLSSFILSHDGKLAESRALLERALTMRRSLLGPGHPLIAQTLQDLSLLSLLQGNLGEAIRSMSDGVVIEEQTVRMISSEARMRSWLYSINKTTEIALGMLLREQVPADARRLALSLVLLRKGRTQDAGTDLGALIRKHDLPSSIRVMVADWQSARRKREELIYRGEALAPEQLQARIGELQTQVDALEARLGQAMLSIRTLQPPALDAIIPEVARQLPADGVLVEVVHARPLHAAARAPAARFGAPHVVALLLFPDQRIEPVDLGPAAAIERAGQALSAAMSSPLSDPIPAAQAMYQRIFAPLRTHLAQRKDVYLSLDGALHLIPFDALHDGRAYLLGKYRFHYLTSGRDLLRRSSQRRPGPPLILGNPDFGEAESAADSAPQSIYQRLQVLPPLPGTAVESRFIAGRVGVQPLLGVDATEGAIQRAQAPWFLHIATHGFYLSDVELPVPLDTRSLLQPIFPPSDAPAVGRSALDRLPGEEGAMNRSAVVLANARQGHRATSTDSDGLLTAQEVRTLDLDGTQLVTLPVCDSARGFASIGQGVYGLRRGFLIAGAETVVTSLWRIDDQTTGELMTRYYGKLLDSEHPGDRLGAMIESMQELRARPGHSHPYYWAPLLVIGQDGPLRRP